MQPHVDTPDPETSTTCVGVISDTHGLLRPEALAALDGSSIIVHAGDIGSLDVVRGLERIAPVRMVRGNTDHEDWSCTLPLIDAVDIARTRIYVLHQLSSLSADPRTGGIAAVVYGHSHMPGMQVRNGVLFFNPGSAGPRRFGLPVSVGRLTVRDGNVSGELVRLDVP